MREWWKLILKLESSNGTNLQSEKIIIIFYIGDKNHSTSKRKVCSKEERGELSKLYNGRLDGHADKVICKGRFPTEAAKGKTFTPTHCTV